MNKYTPGTGIEGIYSTKYNTQWPDEVIAEARDRLAKGLDEIVKFNVLRENMPKKGTKVKKPRKGY